MTERSPREQSSGPGFGAVLRRLREEARLTQEELASRAGLTAKAVSALERGERKRPYPHTVRSLAEDLGCELEAMPLPATVIKGDPVGKETTVPGAYVAGDADALF